MDDELLQEFVNESREHLATIETDLLTIETAGKDVDADLLNKVFRAAHSIKGGSSFFGLTKVKDLAHKAETVLDLMRSRTITPNAEVTNVLLAAFDMLRMMVNNTAESEDVQTEDMVASLGDLASASLTPALRPSLHRTVVLRPRGGGNPVSIQEMDLKRVQRDNQCIYRVDYDLIHDIEAKGLNILKVFREIGECGEILDCEIDFDAVGTLSDKLGNRLPLRLVFATTLACEHTSELLSAPESSIHLLFDPYDKNVQLEYGSAEESRFEEPDSSPAPVEAVAPKIETKSAAVAEPTVEHVAAPQISPPTEPAPKTPNATGGGVPPAAAGGGQADETLRINVSLLDSLMNLAGELVLSRNQLGSAISLGDPRALMVANQRVSHVTSELQEAIMRTRLQPIGNVFSKFPRVVRDLAKSLGKEVILDIKGESVALDRSLAEGLSDPLTHMVRNAVDHGIELPAERVRNGKRPAGTLRIEARHEAGQVLIEISDDGGGIRADKVAESAVKKGLIPAEKVLAMSEAEKIHLIFLPGLSTAAQVTHVSGRGVGMDVVKTNLDRLGGKVAIKSIVGQGSVFTIKLPLTLAIIPALIVSTVAEYFAIPQLNIGELLRVDAAEIQSRTGQVGKARVLMLRDQVIPLIYLDQVLEIPAPTGDQPPAAVDLEIVVVTTGTLQYALVVGTFHESEEIVVKPLGSHLKSLREYAGATVLGTGTIALILDIAGLAILAGLGSSTEATAQDETLDLQGTSATESFLTFNNAPGERCAVALDAVLRVEHIRPSQVELIAGRRSMQYNGQSLPLVTLADTARVKPLENSAELAVLVTLFQGREIGLLGALPVDVVETDAVLDATTHRQKGIQGSVIVNGVTTLVTNLAELVEGIISGVNTASHSDFNSAPLTVSRSRTALVVEDSDFFRAQVKRYLSAAGIESLEASDGESALQVLASHPLEIGIVVTDIEMPGISGLELARRIRSQPRFDRLPIIALSALVSDEDLERGRAAGLTDYQVKLDRDTLIESVERLLENPDIGDRPFQAATDMENGVCAA